MKFEEIIGHAEKISQLRQMIESNRFPQNTLLTGLDGIGKTRIAKIVAESLLCKNPIEGNPCGECESCRAFQNDLTHPDFHLIEPDESKANAVIKIETIRNLQQLISRAPILSSRHVVLIERAETMNESAQNSLLKTLEEPSTPTNFILVSSVKSKLLQTIRSRCAPISFAPLNPNEIEKILEQLGFDKSKARVFSTLGDGSVGSAVKLRDMIDSSNIDLRGDVIQFLKDLLTRKDDLILFERGQSMSENPGKSNFVLLWIFCLKMLLRDLMFLEHGSLIYFADSEKDLRALRMRIATDDLHTLMKLAIETQRRIMSSNVNLRLALENFLLRAANFRGY